MGALDGRTVGLEGKPCRGPRARVEVVLNRRDRRRLVALVLAQRHLNQGTREVGDCSVFDHAEHTIGVDPRQSRNDRGVEVAEGTRPGQRQQGLENLPGQRPLLGPGERRRERLQGRDRRLARSGQADLHGFRPGLNDRSPEPEARRIGKDQRRAARDPVQTEPTVGVGFGGCPPRPIARLRDRGPWHGLAVAVDDPAGDGTDAPRPLEREVGEREEATRGHGNPCRPGGEETLGDHLDPELAGFSLELLGGLKRAVGGRRDLGLFIELGCFREAREVVSGNPELYLDGNPTQRRSARPEHAPGHRENRPRGDRDLHRSCFARTDLKRALALPIAEPTVIETVESGPSPSRTKLPLPSAFAWTPPLLEPLPPVSIHEA